jgi:hypothetical protein
MAGFFPMTAMTAMTRDNGDLGDFLAIRANHVPSCASLN